MKVGTALFLLAAVMASVPRPSLAASCSLARLLTLPVHMAGTSPFVPVGLGGSELPMLLDSGAAVSTLAPSQASRLHLSLQPTPLAFSLQGVGGRLASQSTRVPELTLGGVAVRDVQFLVGGQAPLGAAGVLGQNVLGVADVEYDLPDRVIRLMQPQGCGAIPLAYWANDKTASVLPLERTGSQFAIVTASLNGTAIRVLLDSGAAASIVRADAAARAGIDAHAPAVSPAAPVIGADGHALRSWWAPVASFRIGDEQILHTRLLIADAELGGRAGAGVDMLLGADFLLAHRVYISNSQHKAYFTYSGGPVFARPPDIRNWRNPCPCTPALARRGPGGALAGQWQRHQMKFGVILSPGIRYTPDGLIDLFTTLITQSGGRLNAPILVSRLGLSLDFSTFLPLTTDEPAAASGRPGTWRAVEFSPQSFGLHAGDCEAVSQFARLLSLYSLRDIKAYLPCIPNQDASGVYGLSFRVFVPQDTPSRAVGGG